MSVPVQSTTATFPIHPSCGEQFSIKTSTCHPPIVFVPTHHKWALYDRVCPACSPLYRWKINYSNSNRMMYTDLSNSYVWNDYIITTMKNNESRRKNNKYTYEFSKVVSSEFIWIKCNFISWVVYLLNAEWGRLKILYTSLFGLSQPWYFLFTKGAYLNVRLFSTKTLRVIETQNAALCTSFTETFITSLLHFIKKHKVGQAR